MICPENIDRFAILYTENNMRRFFFIAIIAFATFNLNFVARYAIGAGRFEVCQAHGGVCPHHRHHDKALIDRSHGEHHHNAHHGRDNEKSYKCDCKKDYKNSGLYTIPLPSQMTVRLLAWRTD